MWLGLHEPTDEEFERVTSEFGLHPLAVEDAINAHQRPKLEVYDETLLVVLKPVRYIDHDEVVEIGEIALFVNPEFLISVRHGEPEPAEGGARAPRARAGAGRARPRRGPVRDRGPDRGRLRAGRRGPDASTSRRSRSRCSRPDRHNPAERIYYLEREVLDFRRAVQPLAPAVERLATRPFEVIDRELQPYFRDVHDHLLRVNTQVDQFRDLLSTALGANLTQISVRQNEDMRRITAWVAIARGADRRRRRSTA